MTWLDFTALLFLLFHDAVVLVSRPESQTSYQHLCELSKPSVLPVCALRTGWLLPFWMKPHKTSFITGRWRMTVLYLNTDDFMVIADNGRVLGLGFIRAHLERRGKTVKWLWRAFIFSLQLRSSNLSGFSETSNNYPPYTLKHTHVSVFQIRMVPRVCCRVVQWGLHVSLFCVLVAPYAECPERKHEARSWKVL